SLAGDSPTGGFAAACQAHRSSLEGVRKAHQGQTSAELSMFYQGVWPRRVGVRISLPRAWLSQAPRLHRHGEVQRRHKEALNQGRTEKLPGSRTNRAATVFLSN